jgi:anti-sigma B factor antagonist
MAPESRSRKSDTVPAPTAPPFGYAVVHIDDRAEVAVRGELDLGNSPGLLRDLLADMEIPISAITLDLERVTYVDSSGLGALVAAKHRADQRGIAFTIVGVSAQTRRIFDITDLAEMFGIADSPDVDAVETTGPGTLQTQCDRGG